MIAPAPESLLALLAPPASKTPVLAPACDLDTPANILAAMKYAQIAEPSISGQGGNANAYRVACKVRDLGAGQNMGFEILWEVWNPRCEPPWSVDELQAITDHAYKYGQNQAGVYSPESIAADFTPVDGAPEPLKPVLTEPYSIHDLEGEPPPREWILPEWIPKGEVSSLYGDGGTGKTLLAIQLGVCVSYGLSFLGMPVEQMPVFAALAEDERGEVHRRVKEFRRYYEIDPRDRKPVFRIFSFPGEDYRLIHCDDKKFRKGPFYDRLTEFLKTMPEGPKLLILDTLADVFDGNENVRAQANFFVKNVLRGLCLKYQATTLLLAHPSRAGINSADGLSGSTGWNNAVRTRLTLTTHEVMHNVRTLKRIKCNYAQAGEVLTLCYQQGVFEPASEKEKIQELITEQGDGVLEILRDAAEAGQPFGDAVNHNRLVYKHLSLFTNGSGRPMTKEALKTIINGLIETRQLERRRGLSRGNGLYPVL